MVARYMLHTVELQPALQAGLMAYEGVVQDLEMAAMCIDSGLVVGFEVMGRMLVEEVGCRTNSVTSALLMDLGIAAVGNHIG